ncbi:uncharacterized protein F4822DRAFT_424809 [Hypoxylon trugodes]|uniref:uncharacterized protein n=1 Tax=Hypoxylon trugodes TaxID=326681 RepID=UPI0021A1DA09|nr:uncharacterized protein F4822DRAFT_424809 [Hypoxylon trugodes]KAI1394331.1 hypothetical protein F4822DRAFT_424809 [Hypoxylon trugodes]
MASRAIRDAMMADLGNSRLEELATDGVESQSRPRLPAAQQGGQHAVNPAAANWTSAWAEGIFDDEDARAVRGLDPLDGGNAHRLNRAATGQKGGASDRKAIHVMVGSAMVNVVPRYDPRMPGYSKGRRNQNADNGFTRSSLGGLVPPGASVKRWGPKQSLSSPTPTAASEPVLTTPEVSRRFNGDTAEDQILYSAEGIHVTLTVDASSQCLPGRITLYSRHGGAVVIWELSTDSKHSRRGDMRLVLLPLHSGCKVHLRRWEDMEQSKLHSSLIVFDKIPDAIKLVEMIENYCGRPIESSVPVFKETTVDTFGATEPANQPQAGTYDEPLGLIKVDNQSAHDKAPEARQNEPDEQANSELAGPIVPNPHDPTPMLMFVLSQLDVIEATPLGVSLSQDSLQILSTVTDQEYKRMTTERDAVVQYLEDHGLNVPRPKEQAAAQVAASELLRYDAFKALDLEEQRKSTAFVYTNIVHGDTRVVRSPEKLVGLRSSACSCPGELRRFGLAHPGVVVGQTPTKSQNLISTQTPEDHAEEKGPIEEDSTSNFIALINNRFGNGSSGSRIPPHLRGMSPFGSTIKGMPGPTQGT